MRCSGNLQGLSNSETERELGLLPFVRGISVISIQVSTSPLPKAFPSNTQYIHWPLYAPIDIAKLTEQTFRVAIGDVYLPMFNLTQITLAVTT